MWRENRWNGRGFDLVVLDLTVPGAMGGRETLEELRKLDPDVRAIVSSGYSEDAVLSDFRAYGFIDALRKPYTLEELGVVLARIRPSGR
jgi:CheY-like chemotaxis protein